MQLISLQKVKQPLKNTYGSGTIFTDQMRHVSASLYNRVRRTPELLSMLDTVVTDHFGGAVDFFDANGKPLGSTRQNSITRMWEDMGVQDNAFYGQALDFFVDGSCFGFHVSPNSILTSKQKEVFAKIKAINSEMSTFIDEKSNMPKKISYIAASTMAIKNDAFGEVFYVQSAAGKNVRWEKDQVVHIKNMDFNGEIRGMAPLKAIVTEVVMMYMLKDNIIAALSNGGSADNIIALKNANGTSKARFNRLRVALESFSHIKKSHGNMPIDGEVAVHPLGTQLKDMEYQQLAMFCISEFGLALGLPSSRVPFLMSGKGGNTNKGELSGNSEDSYQTKINARRRKWENAWNKVFRLANFTYKFRRDNLQDDVRESQSSVQRAAYVTGIQTSLQKAGKELKIEAHLAILSGKKMNISDDDVQDLDVDRMQKMNEAMNPMASAAGPGGSMQADKMQSKSKVSNDRSAAKTSTASNNGVNA